MIPGTFPVAATMAPPKFQYKTSAVFIKIGSGGTDVTLPSTILPGDLIVAWDIAISDTVPALETPPGFTSAVSDTFDGAGSFPCAAVDFSYKYADSSDAGRYFNGISGSGRSAVTILVFNSPTARPFGGYVSGSPDFDLGAGGTAPPQTVTAGSAPTISFGLYFQRFGTFTPGMSPSQDGGIGDTSDSNLRTMVYYKIFNSSPTDVGVSLGSSPNTSCLACCRIDGLL